LEIHLGPGEEGIESRSAFFAAWEIFSLRAGEINAELRLKKFFKNGRIGKKLAYG
jgi:hypothetical protein